MSDGESFELVMGSESSGSGSESDSESDDSEDERERKLAFLQQKLTEVQEQMKVSTQNKSISSRHINFV